MKTRFLFFLSFVIFFNCKNDNKKNLENNNSEINQPTMVEKPLKFDLPSVENLLLSPDLVNLSSELHSFEEDIVFEEINLVKTSPDTYTIIFVIDPSTNFDSLKSWRIGMYFFAKDPSKFESKADSEKGFKTVATLAAPKMMDEEVVVLLENLKIIPKEISLLRVYLYKSNNEMNKKFYNTNDIRLP